MLARRRAAVAWRRRWLAGGGGGGVAGLRRRLGDDAGWRRRSPAEGERRRPVADDGAGVGFGVGGGGGGGVGDGTAVLRLPLVADGVFARRRAGAPGGRLLGIRLRVDDPDEAARRR
mmetsp:Transcript_114319/g.201707  ORF Transcript_114319/g.201707 Transcript_114319/m.201707 type:complete len:117 (-) Transcript_114319:820-1170(-)